MNEWSLVALGDKMFLDFLPSALFNNNVLLVNEVRISAKLRFSPEGKGVIKMLCFYLRFMDSERDQNSICQVCLCMLCCFHNANLDLIVSFQELLKH